MSPSANSDGEEEHAAVSSERQVPAIGGEEDRFSVSPDVGITAEAVTKVPDKSEPTLTNQVYLGRFEFGKNLVGWCIALLFLITLIGTFTEEGQLLINLSETLKLVLTTSLGFLFGRSVLPTSEPD